jgi:transposase
VAQKATREVALNAEAKKLANVLTKAAQGDKKATQGIASLQLLANRDMLTAREFMRLRAQGMSENEAKKLAELSSAKVAREVGEVVKRAKKLAPGAKAKLSKKALAEIKASARAGAEKLIAVTNKAAKERGKVKGLVVARQPGKIVNRRSGTEKTTKGVAGYLISAKGRAIPGVWS